MSLADAKNMTAIEHDPRLALIAAIGEQTVGAVEILGDPQTAGIAEDAQMARRDVGIVEHHIIVVSPPDAEFTAGQPMTRDHVAMAREDFEPDDVVHYSVVGGYFVHVTASRKRRVRASALSKVTPLRLSRDTSASVPRS